MNNYEFGMKWAADYQMFEYVNLTFFQPPIELPPAFELPLALACGTAKPIAPKQF
jgi:hypothetical protein